jgi:hypothetical protein
VVLPTHFRFGSVLNVSIASVLNWFGGGFVLILWWCWCFNAAGGGVGVFWFTRGVLSSCAFLFHVRMVVWCGFGVAMVSFGGVVVVSGSSGGRRFF